MASPRYLDSRLVSLLDSLRTRVRRYVVWDSALAIAAVVLAAFWIGLALDYLPVQLGGTEMPRLGTVDLVAGRSRYRRCDRDHDVSRSIESPASR